ncbi:copper-binding protein [Ramlibacter rhizophilus]|uniref:Copper-binding protein n=2 Tax=Ramlibacter rhizophilus TaxID=1781167 RepID=A0A4Z0C0P6_9BURK|nr:copper-binding protein [Ramlibacter rhizophilus]
MLALGTGAWTVQAQTPPPDPTVPAASAPAEADWTEGEVRRVDAAAGKLTLRHGPIRHLDMPGMTMVFRAAEPQLLDGLKTGDKVRFKATESQGQYTVTALEPVR